MHNIALDIRASYVMVQVVKRLQHFGCWSLARCRMAASLLCYIILAPNSDELIFLKKEYAHAMDIPCDISERLPKLEVSPNYKL